ncbi:membrane-associated tyrosine- and threonine-specific cdc2-inhibitory kinase [Bradysia coprophila]|uniref:membrane-associated tyrosine- and threonine-specific cdc2-inhibitory kinase n=1 Tax=Bradysia coprophila TaxID=38358 RepID=UPI00187D7E47|nr:membrane-associated tyrosine- and threonine-specific cdc2-inhibitory kinase [Bradysia coprophila]
MSIEKTFLPVPEFESFLQHSFKQENSKRSRKPPKLNPNTSFSKLASPSYQVISFRNQTPNELNQWKSTADVNFDSYFDKCFDLLAKIGEGSFSEVFKVRSKEDGKLYAIKKSNTPYRSEFYRERSLDEVRNFELFSENANCVTFYKAWEQNGYLYIQLELCESIESHMKDLKNVDEDFYWSVLVDILLAMKALHDRDLIHLDIKLDNILVDEDNVCKLSDFGLVTNEKKPQRRDGNEGDSRYIAPELLDGNFSKAADVFSLGVTMLELITNLELQANGPLWHELRQGVLPPACVKLMSKNFEEIIRQMMSPSPNHRPDVNTLLRWPKIREELERRRKAAPIKYFKSCCRKTKNFVWRNICQVKDFLGKFRIFRFYRTIYAMILPNKEPPPPMPEDTSFPFFDMSDTDSPIKNFSLSNLRNSDVSSTKAKIVNSTPVLRHGYRSRNSLLSNSSFNSSINSSINESSVTRKKLFASTDSE